MTFYLFRSANSEDYLGTETIQLFSDRAEAIRCMRETASENHGMTWEELIKKYGSDPFASVGETWIDIPGDFFGESEYYAVEPIVLDQYVKEGVA